ETSDARRWGDEAGKGSCLSRGDAGIELRVLRHLRELRAAPEFAEGAFPARRTGAQGKRPQQTQVLREAPAGDAVRVIRFRHHLVIGKNPSRLRLPTFAHHSS